MKEHRPVTFTLRLTCKRCRKIILRELPVGTNACGGRCEGCDLTFVATDLDMVHAKIGGVLERLKPR